MNEGYNNDQFYGLWRSEGQDGRANWYQTSKPDNPPFIYPSRSIRTQDSDGKMSNKTMQRGYIRTLLSSAQGAHLSIRKCGFQFNPSILSTNVAMSTDVVNAMQLDISNLAVPMVGNSNFSFELFFDRSMEMNNGGRAKKLNGDDAINLFTASDPAEIGVFRDVGELCAIIGVGVSPETIKFADGALRNTISAASAADTNPDKTVTSSANAKALQGVSTIISPANYGNSAFLVPNPVRAVFSSLFMVEGYVSNITIEYVKFSTNMVPMMAKVRLDMSAIYIGYAKAKTFTTMSLDAAATAYQDEQNALQAAQNALFIDLRSSLPSVNVLAAAPDSNTSGNHGPALYLRDLTAGKPFVGVISMDDVTGTMPSTADSASPATFDTNTKFEMWGPYATKADWKETDTPKWVYNDNNTGIEWSQIPGGWFSSKERGTSSTSSNTGVFVHRFSTKITCTFLGTVVTGSGSRTTTVSNPDFQPLVPSNFASISIFIGWTGPPVPNAVPVVTPGYFDTKNDIPKGSPTPAAPGTSSPVGKVNPKKSSTTKVRAI